MFIRSLLWITLVAVILTNPVPQDLNGVNEIDDTDESVLLPNALIPETYPLESQNIGCTSDGGMDEIFDEKAQEGRILRRTNACPAPATDSAEHRNTGNQGNGLPSSSQEGQGTPEHKKSYINENDVCEGTSQPWLLTCGGPKVWLHNMLMVLNCVRGKVF